MVATSSDQLQRVDFVDVDEAVEDGEDGEAGSGVYVKFGAAVAAMGGHCMEGDAEFVSNFLVGFPLGRASQYVFLPPRSELEASSFSASGCLVAPCSLILEPPLRG